MADTKIQIFTYNNLTLYDTLLKGYVDAGDAKSLKTVAIEGNTLKFYRVSEPVGETTPAYTITLPETDISGLIPKITGATAGNVVTAKADGTVEDSGIKASNLATKAEVKAVKDKVDINTSSIATLNGNETTAGSVKKAVKDASDIINATIGTVEEGKTVVQMISEAITSATYDDTAVKASIKTNTDAIAVLNGTGAGSVSKQVSDAVAAIVADAPEAYDTLKEISDWISSHFEDASAMNSQINTNKTDIASLKALVGTLPEGVASTTVVEYIAEVVGASKTELTSAIATAKSEAISSANNYSDGLNTAMDIRVTALETKTGEGFVEITEDEINALFA